MNIGGNTIHTQFSIPIKSAKFSELKNEPLRKFQIKNKDLKFIIMDKMSMVGARLLHHIECRCSPIFPNDSEKFGGLLVYIRVFQKKINFSIFNNFNTKTLKSNSFLVKKNNQFVRFS